MSIQPKTDRKESMYKEESEAAWHSARTIGLAPIFMAIGLGVWGGAGYVGYKLYEHFISSKEPAVLENVVPAPASAQNASALGVELPVNLPAIVAFSKNSLVALENSGRGPRE